MRSSLKALEAMESNQPLDASIQLREGERIVSQFGPYFATSQRVLLVLKKATGTVVEELSYDLLTGIHEVNVPNHRKMLAGSILVVVGLVLTFGWYMILPLVAVFVGIGLIFHGARGEPRYYQLEGRDMDRRQLLRWQVQHYGAGSFVASISTMTGLGPDKRSSVR